jgi:hypothetical protein
MWFAALSNYRSEPWFVAFTVRLLEGSPQVTALLEKNPFPDRPPRYIRARVDEYSFTTFEARGRTGEWWSAKRLGEYLPAIGLRQTALLKSTASRK